MKIVIPYGYRGGGVDSSLCSDITFDFSTILSVGKRSVNKTKASIVINGCRWRRFGRDACQNISKDVNCCQLLWRDVLKQRSQNGMTQDACDTNESQELLFKWSSLCWENKVTTMREDLQVKTICFRMTCLSQNVFQVMKIQVKQPSKKAIRCMCAWTRKAKSSSGVKRGKRLKSISCFGFTAYKFQGRIGQV